MRRMNLILGFPIGFAMLALSCTPTEAKPAPGPTESRIGKTQVAKAAVQTKEAAKAARDYTYVRKSEFVTEMNKELSVIQEEMTRLFAKVEAAGGEAKASAKVKLDELRVKWALAKTHIDKANSATEDTWEDVKGGFIQSYSELKESFNKTRQWLSDTIKP